LLAMMSESVGTKRPASPSMGHDGASAIVPGVSLTLSVQEVALFDLLLEVIAKRGLQCILRVAGGWVRDKLMGREAHDIDIAIDDRMGKAFAEDVVGYMHECGRSSEVGSVGVIKSNPDQSKHLETATVRVLGFELDFVNLRAEEYTDSRIPVMRIGTALEDALRRDLTINSLFYNINLKAVEDFTGRGMADLTAKICRTPLPPLQTMIDDPLRALRAVRFATRYSFSLEDDLRKTLCSKEVSDALANKVSKERLMTELNGMLSGPSPADSLSLLHAVSLFPVVFQPPPLPDIPPSWADVAHGIVQECAKLPPSTVASLLNVDPPTCSPAVHVLPKEERRLLFLSSALSPLRPFSTAQGKKAVAAPEHVMRISLKGTLKDAQDTATVLLTADELARAADALFPAPGGSESASGGSEEELKVQIGTVLKKTGAIWRLSLLLALCERLQRRGGEGAMEDGEREAETERMVSLEKKIREGWNLDNVWELKTLVSGNEVCELLGLDKKTDGRRIGEVHREMATWVLKQHKPLEVTQEDCIAWLKDTYPR